MCGEDAGEAGEVKGAGYGRGRCEVMRNGNTVLRTNLNTVATDDFTGILNVKITSCYWNTRNPVIGPKTNAATANARIHLTTSPRQPYVTLQA